MMDLRGYCGKCGLKQMSAMDLQRDPFRDEAVITTMRNIQIPDPRNPDNVIRSQEQVKHIQKPALICSACYSDATDIPTAPPIWVGGKSE
jgi:hypothetical protein